MAKPTTASSVSNVSNNNSAEAANNNSQQNGGAYQALPESPVPAPANTPLNRAIKHDLFPEVTFCNLSAEELADGAGHSRVVRTSIIAIDGEGNLTCLMNSSQVKKRKRLISNESGDSIDSGSTEKKAPKMPDGGYGWVVVFASLVVSLIADGLSFSFGLINAELLEYFGQSTSKTAWISSLFFSVPLLMGPIWSNLVDKYGCRKMTIIGGLVSAVGFAMSSFCNSIEMLMVTFGIISGLGLGIGYVTAVVSIAFWFDKKRTFATGIGASGTGIGTFVYARLTSYLIESYGWRGATLILGGTMLNACVCGALMRDPDWLIEENRLESRSQSVTTFSNSSVCLEEIKKLLDTGITKEAVLDSLVTKNNTEANQQIDDPLDTGLKRYRSEIFLPTFLSIQELDSICEVKSLSRRSLRHKEGVEAPSRENLLSMSSGAGGYPPSTAIIGSPDDTLMGGIAQEAMEAAKKSYLASIETLSPSEKRSSPVGSIRSSDEGYLTQKHASSRYSLNENLFMAKHTTPSISNLKVNGLRHNSVDILSEDMHCYYKDETFALLDHGRRPGPTVIAMPDREQPTANSEVALRRARLDSITGIRRLSRSKKPSQHRSNLRRNISIRNSNFLKDMRIHRNSIHYRGAMLNTHRYRLRASSCPNIYRNSMTTIAKEEEDTWYESFVDTMKSIFDFSMFLDLKFALFNLSTLFLFIWFIIPYLYLPDYMKQYNYEVNVSAVLISAVGIAQTVGMIGLGYVGDQPWMNINICYSLCMLVCGASVFCMPMLMTSYNGLMAMCVIFGFTFASSFSFTPSILVSIVDLDDFTCAYGLVLLVQGVGMIAGPPIAGLIYESVGRWDDSFYYAGIFIALSGVCSYMIEFCEKKAPKESDSDVSETKKAQLLH
ncbi:monocarboxylate transporter 14 [Drosophila persimilis]|uniref:Monocarboxylate transporter 14 n=1 Tax=Drosophila pseudoobscura pseudoobscura TaxID=46245 RepID=A0A6I8VT49_DROPS|nr:monocarboxylate transporter 14 [Drosophila persimilis]XP_033234250.1 monocarboxylate transporter 14 [Drosophila pseudoobscura]